MRDSFSSSGELPDAVAEKANAIINARYDKDSIDRARKYVASFNDCEMQKNIAVGIFEAVLLSPDNQDRMKLRSLGMFMIAFPEQNPNILASALNKFCADRSSEGTVCQTLQGILKERGDSFDWDELIGDLSSQGRKNFVKFVNQILRDDQGENKIPEQCKLCLSEAVRNMSKSINPDVSADILPFN